MNNTKSRFLCEKLSTEQKILRKMRHIFWFDGTTFICAKQ